MFRIIKPLIGNELWQKALSMGGEMPEAISNPNTDFMTKLLFDARFFQKKLGKDVAYWSSAIFALKMLLSEKAATEKEIRKATGINEKESAELLAYLKNMSEILQEGKGKYALNYANSFSKIFKG